MPKTKQHRINIYTNGHVAMWSSVGDRMWGEYPHPSTASMNRLYYVLAKHYAILKPYAIRFSSEGPRPNMPWFLSTCVEIPQETDHA